MPPPYQLPVRCTQQRTVAHRSVKNELTFESDFISHNLQKLVEHGRVLIIVEDLLFRVLILFNVDDAHF